MNLKKKKIIIDSDLGDDIDDAFAIYYALLRKEFDVIGITTVYENTYLRGRLAKKITNLLGLKIPVYAGYKIPIFGLNLRPVDRLFSQYEPDLENYKPDNVKEDYEEETIDYILDKVKSLKDELTLVCIGPLTNIAKAILKDKETMKLVGKIVTMSGSFYDDEVEWNITCDIEAAKIVYESGIKIEAFGLDVTNNLRIKDKDLEELLKKEVNGPMGYLLDLTRLWYKDYNRPIILYDVLPLNYMINNGNVTMEEHHILIDSNGQFKLGQTMNLDRINKKLISNNYKIHSGKNVKIDSFFKDIKDLIINI